MHLIHNWNQYLNLTELTGLTGLQSHWMCDFIVGMHGNLVKNQCENNCWKSLGQCGKTVPSWECQGCLHCAKGQCEGSLVYLGNTNFSDSFGFSVPVLYLRTFTGFSLVPVLEWEPSTVPFLVLFQSQEPFFSRSFSESQIVAQQYHSQSIFLDLTNFSPFSVNFSFYTNPFLVLKTFNRFILRSILGVRTLPRSFSQSISGVRTLPRSFSESPNFNSTIPSSIHIA